MSARDSSSRRRTPCRVLVVDDHDDTRLAHRMALEHFGFTVTEARTGLEALALAQADQPQVVLLDIEIPEIDGRQLARMIRADPALRGAALLAVSALAEPAERDSALLAGVDAFVAKPVPPLALVKLVQDHVREDGRQPPRP